MYQPPYPKKLIVKDDIGERGGYKHPKQDREVGSNQCVVAQSSWDQSKAREWQHAQYYTYQSYTGLLVMVRCPLSGCFHSQHPDSPEYRCRQINPNRRPHYLIQRRIGQDRD